MLIEPVLLSLISLSAIYNQAGNAAFYTGKYTKVRLLVSPLPLGHLIPWLI